MAIFTKNYSKIKNYKKTSNLSKAHVMHDSSCLATLAISVQQYKIMHFGRVLKFKASVRKIH